MTVFQEAKGDVLQFLIDWQAFNQSIMAETSKLVTELDGPVREQLVRNINTIGAGIEANRNGANDPDVETALIVAVRKANNARHDNRLEIAELANNQLYLREQNKVLGRLIGELS